MNTYHVERHATAGKRAIVTRFHVVREDPAGVRTTLRKYVRLWEARNACETLQQRQAAKV